MAIPLLDAAGMRELDRATIEDIGVPGTVLMEVAGRGCAEAVACAGDIRHRHHGRRG